MKYVIGLDFGGGSSKVTLLEESGVIKAENTVEYPTLYPKNGWVEQNPLDWYKAACTNIRAVISKSNIKPTDICCISLDAATHTAVLTDENYKVLMPSIYWTDTRSVDQASRLAQNPLISEKTLHKPSTVWTLPQLLWIKENKPDVWQKVRHVLFAKDFVRHLFTGDEVTDFIEAQGSMLYDFHTKSWSDELCALIDLDKSVLPKIVAPTDIVGRLTDTASWDTGLPKGTPVLCGTTDTVMEVFASGAINKKNMTVKLATAGRICVITDKAYTDANLVTYSHIIDGLWYPGTATKSCAASFRWFRDTFGGDYKELDTLAEAVPVGSDGLYFHPHLNGEMTPYNDPLLCGSFTGLRAFHSKAHFTRAVLEGVAYSLLDCLNTLKGLGIDYDSNAIIIGGGSKSALWRQIVSDVLGITLIQKNCSDSSLGSAMMAGVACGLFADYQSAVDACSKVVSVTTPNKYNHDAYLEKFKTYKRIHDALAPVYHGEL